MNKLTHIGSILALVYISFGCASTQDKSAKLLASTAVVVDATMKGWASYVVAGRATPAQEQSVRTAYSQYQQSMTIAQNAMIIMMNTKDQSAWTSASLALTQNKIALLNLIQSIEIGRT